MTEPSERADTTITLDFADAAMARDAFDQIEVWLHEVGIANDCTLAMSTAPAEPSDAQRSGDEGECRGEAEISTGPEDTIIDRLGRWIEIARNDGYGGVMTFGDWGVVEGLLRETRTHIEATAREPSDAEVEAAARAITSPCDDPVQWKWNVPKARAALVAAAKVRAGR